VSADWDKNQADEAANMTKLRAQALGAQQ
jgi:hypothetical protein